MRLLAALTLLPALLFANALTAPAQSGTAKPDAAAIEGELISKERRTWELYKNKDVKELASAILNLRKPTSEPDETR
jgi:hypothetical protein